MILIKESLDKSKIVNILNYLKKYEKDIYIIGGAAITLQSSYKTKDIDIINFPYIEEMEKDPNIKVIDYTYNEDGSILGFQTILIKGVQVDLIYSDIPYTKFHLDFDKLNFTSLFGFKILSIKSLFEVSKTKYSEKLEYLIKDNNLKLDFINNFKNKEDRIKFLICWESIFGELEINLAKKYINGLVR